LRDGRLRQVTKDHTYVQMLVDEGAITAEEASHHPHRSLVTQVLQGEPIEPNYSVREAIKGDRYLLCSDGLSNVVSMATMGDVLRDYRDADACAERLIDLACGPAVRTTSRRSWPTSWPSTTATRRRPSRTGPTPRRRSGRARGRGRPGARRAGWSGRRRRRVERRLLVGQSPPHRVLVLTLGVLLAAAGVWYIATG
jgi:hypothetical protein